MTCKHGNPVYNCEECAEEMRIEPKAMSEVVPRPEYGWLVELKSSVTPSPTWYGENDEGVIGWTRDNMKALRFARREDAERVIACDGLTEAFACEHAWG